MKNILILFSFILVCFSSVFAQVDESVAPLKVGNFWRYNDDLDSKFNFKVVDSNVVIEGKEYYDVEFRRERDTGAGHRYYRLREDGFYVSYDTTYADSEFVYYKKDAQLGDSWQQREYRGLPKTLYHTVIGVGDGSLFGKVVTVKQIAITDSMVYDFYQYWTEEFGLLSNVLEWYFADLWGCIVDGDTLGNVTVGVEKENIQNKDFVLHQNFPNPFNPTTTISYSIPNSQIVELKVYDLLGNEVDELVNEFKPEGNYSVQFNASNLSSGIYFYTIKTGNFIQTKKLIILK